MTIKSGSGQACAACKYQRRRCTPECLLAPFFPADEPKMFQNVHRLFGVSNVTKILEKLPKKLDRDDAMRSIIYESDMRERFPVAGCCGVLSHLYHQLMAATKELDYVNATLQSYREASQKGQQQMVLQQQQHIVEYGGEQFVFNDGADMMSVIRAQMEAFGLQKTDVVGFDTEEQHVFDSSEAQQFSNNIVFDHERRSYCNPTTTKREEFESR